MREMCGFVGPEDDSFLNRMTDLLVQDGQNDQVDD